MKVSEFYRIVGSISALVTSKELNVAVSFRLRHMAKSFNDELRELEERRTKLVKEFGIQSKETGEYNVDPVKLDKFKEEWENVQKEEITLPEVKLTLKESEPAKLSAMDYANLDFIIEEGSGGKSKVVN